MGYFENIKVEELFRNEEKYKNPPILGRGACANRKGDWVEAAEILCCAFEDPQRRQDRL